MSILIHPLDSCPPPKHTHLQPLSLNDFSHYVLAMLVYAVHTHTHLLTHKHTHTHTRGQRLLCYASLLRLRDLIWDIQMPSHRHSLNSNKVWIYSNTAASPSLVCLFGSCDIWTYVVSNNNTGLKKSADCNMQTLECHLEGFVIYLFILTIFRAHTNQNMSKSDFTLLTNHQI